MIVSLVAGVVFAENASAASTLGSISGVRVAAVTSSSITVKAQPTRGAQSYTLYVSRVKGDLYWTQLQKKAAARRTTGVRTPSATVHGLPYGAYDYYVRFAAVRNSYKSLSPIIPVRLTPSVPTAWAHIGADGAYLAWSCGYVDGLDVDQSSTPDMRSGWRRYALRGKSTRFTPYGLQVGQTYYLRVRARNGAAASAWTPVMRLTPTMGEQPVRIATQNILSYGFDGSRKHGRVIAPWSQRSKIIGAQMRAAGPDIVALQEAGAGRTQYKGVLSALGANYGQSYATMDYDKPHPIDYGEYVLFRTDRWSNYYAGKSYSGGRFDISAGHTATFAALRNKATGAPLLVVNAHLDYGTWNENVRTSQTKNLAYWAARISAAFGNIPYVIVGDMNSHQPKGTSIADAPGAVMSPNHLPEVFSSAQELTNAGYDTYNDYASTPSHGYGPIDRFFVTPAIGIRSWHQWLNLDSRGNFVGTLGSDHNLVTADLTVPIPLG